MVDFGGPYHECGVGRAVGMNGNDLGLIAEGDLHQEAIGDIIKEQMF